ncbi:MAG: hypothetical protein V1773_16710 [bacterium]
MGIDRCPICHEKQIIIDPLSKTERIYKLNCPVCGKYEIDKITMVVIENNFTDDTAFAYSFWICHHQLKNNGYVSFNSKIKDSIEIPFITPKPQEQANNFLLWFGEKFENSGEYDKEIYIELKKLKPIIGTKSILGVGFIVEYLREQSYILTNNIPINESSGGHNLSVKLTFKGWERYFELQKVNKESKLVFMAMDFKTEAIKKIYTEVIKEAVEQTGFKIRRLDENPVAGLIDDKLRLEIKRSKFLIADLTDANNGAYFEAGYAEGLGLQVIYICEESVFNNKNKSTHFDTNHHLTVTWKDEPEALKHFADKLKNTIRVTFPEYAIIEDDLTLFTV